MINIWFYLEYIRNFLFKKYLKMVKKKLILVEYRFYRISFWSMGKFNLINVYRIDIRLFIVICIFWNFFNS